MKKLPAKIFVHRENEGDKEDEYFQVNADIKTIACDRKRVRVGEYKLVREVEVTSEPEIVAEVG